MGGHDTAMTDVAAGEGRPRDAALDRRQVLAAGAALVWSVPTVRTVQVGAGTSGSPPPGRANEPKEPREPTDPPDGLAPCLLLVHLQGAMRLDETYEIELPAFFPERNRPMTVEAASKHGHRHLDLHLQRVSERSLESAMKGRLTIETSTGDVLDLRVSGHWDARELSLQGSAVGAQGAHVRLRFLCA